MKGIEIILLLIGGMFGVYLRYKIVDSPLTIGSLPVNVLLVNIIGSFILGAFSILSLTWNIDQKYALLIAVGFCGSFTTMSTFTLETVQLIDNKQIGIAATNILANVTLPLGAVIAGRSFLNLIIKLGFT